MLDELEDELAALRVAYERYFLGIDRLPPLKPRANMDRKMRRLTSGTMGSTALRFRLESLRGRYVTYRQHWERIIRQIEEGRYVRIVAEGERRRRLEEFERRAALERKHAQAERDALERAEDAAEKPESSPADPAKTSPRVSRSARPDAPTQLPEGMDAKEARELFKQFVAAKRAAGESTRGLSYAALVNQIARDLPRLQARHGQGVRLEVATDGSKVKLRARLTRKSV